MIATPKDIKALNDYSIFVKFSDGVQGVVDLKRLANKGVFREWDKNNCFEKVYINDYGAIAWNDDIDICPDNIYLQLTGQTFEQWKQNQRQNATSACVGFGCRMDDFAQGRVDEQLGENPKAGAVE